MTRHVDPMTLDALDSEALRRRAADQHRLSRRQQALLAAAGMSEADVAWYVLAVSVGGEKAVEKALAEAGIPHWLPACEVQSVRRRGRTQGPRPARIVAAFPGYVLVRIVWCAEHWAAIRCIDGVRSALGVNGEAVAVPDAIVRKLQHDLRNDDELKAQVRRAVRLGDQVLIKDGPFAEWVGRLVALGEDRGAVEIDILGRATPVSLDLAQISRLG